MNPEGEYVGTSYPSRWQHIAAASAEMIANFMKAISAAILALLLLAFCIDAVLQNFFGRSFPDLSELGTYAFAAMASTALSVALVEGAHVQVALVTRRFPSAFQRPMRIFVASVGVIAAMTLIACTFSLVHGSFISGERSLGMSGIELWIPESSLLLGAVTFLLEMVLPVGSRHRSDLHGREPSR